MRRLAKKVAWYALLSACILGLLILLGTQAFPRRPDKPWHVVGDSHHHPPPVTYPADFWRPHAHGQRPDLPPLGPPPRAGPGGGHGHPHPDHDWAFDYARDRRSHGLSQEQCEAAFPLLYNEIDRAVAYRRAIGKVSEEDVNAEWRREGIVRAMIRDNQLYVIEARGVRKKHRNRALATLNSLHKAVIAYAGVLPDIEFTLTLADAAYVGDYANHTTWSFARLPHEENLWLMPDFGFWGWPGKGTRSYAEHQSVLDEEEPLFADKIPKLVWRGGLGNGGSKFRKALIRQSEGHSWNDVQAVNWKDTEAQPNVLSMQEHCNYMFTAQTEGNTYSGRLLLLLNCNSVTLTHRLRYIEHFTHLMQLDGPEQNHIEVSRSWEELPETMEYLLGHEGWLGHSGGNLAEAERIANNARTTFRERYLTSAAEACYWRALIRGWASVQGFEPERWEEAKIGEGMGGKKPRGVPFESYAIMEATEWEVPQKGTRYVCYDEN